MIAVKRDPSTGAGPADKVLGQADLPGALALTGIAKYVGPQKRRRGKDYPYECGSDVIGTPRARFEIKFYLVAVLFIACAGNHDPAAAQISAIESAVQAAQPSPSICPACAPSWTSTAPWITPRYAKPARKLA